MQALTLALYLLACVLLSSVIDQIARKISIPLIQIFLGVVIALLAAGNVNITIDPELFLVLFIAPLLYDEAKNADKAALWKNIKPVLALAIGLVVVTTLAIGFSLNYVVPSIPLAAAFALGAALGPTDAVAVTSLSKEITIPERQKAILKGELLLNDASGIVAFQFALAAVVTMSFSLLDASVNFFIEFIGGLLFGVVLGFLGNFLVRKVRSIGVENTTFHVLFELFVPLLVYLISDACHVSGIIAVVVAGLMNVISPRMIGPQISRMNIVSSSVWRVVTFALNGIVFVLLGTQLPKAMSTTWDDTTIPNTHLIALVLGITFILYLVRFLWVLAMDHHHVRTVDKRKMTKADIKDALITTLCGAKGTITLSILFTIPTYAYYDYSISAPVPFPQRDLIIFLACGVILCTLLIATFVVPLLCPKPKKSKSENEERLRLSEAQIEIMRRVVEELTARQTDDNALETRAVIQSYNNRIERVKEKADIEDPPDPTLRLQALAWEEECAFEAIEDDLVSPLTAYRYLARIEQTSRLLRHGHADRNSLSKAFVRIRLFLRKAFHTLMREMPNKTLPDQAEELQKLQLMTAEHVIKLLEVEVARDDVPTEDASGLLLEYQRLRDSLAQERPSLSDTLQVVDAVQDIRRTGLSLELEEIQQMYEDGTLSRAEARRLRENVNIMMLDLDDHV